jgi:hypothetical protein
MKDDDKNNPVDIPQTSGLNESGETIELLEEQLESNSEAPVKPKRKYQWKGEKKRKRSEGHNEKIAKSLTGRNLTEEHRQNIAEAMIGNDNFHK